MQKSLLSCQVCPDKKIHSSTLQHHVPNSQQESSFITWNCFVLHLLPVSTAWLHTHTISNAVGSAVPALYLLHSLLWWAVSYSRTLKTNHDVLRSVSWDAGKPLLMCYRITCSCAVVVSPEVPCQWCGPTHFIQTVYLASKKEMFWLN